MFGGGALRVLFAGSNVGPREARVGKRLVQIIWEPTFDCYWHFWERSNDVWLLDSVCHGG